MYLARVAATCGVESPSATYDWVVVTVNLEQLGQRLSPLTSPFARAKLLSPSSRFESSPGPTILAMIKYSQERLLNSLPHSISFPCVSLHHPVEQVEYASQCSTLTCSNRDFAARLVYRLGVLFILYGSSSSLHFVAMPNVHG
jgi:hypothetical protein